jgi:adenylate cyclase
MGERNAGVPPDKRIEFRIGINLGDIIHDERDIFGDGVRSPPPVDRTAVA